MFIRGLVIAVLFLGVQVPAMLSLGGCDDGATVRFVESDGDYHYRDFDNGRCEYREYRDFDGRRWERHDFDDGRRFRDGRDWRRGDLDWHD